MHAYVRYVFVGRVRARAEHMTNTVYSIHNILQYVLHESQIFRYT